MPSDEKTHAKFAMPKVDCKSHKSKLYHSKLARNLLMSHLSEIPIQRAFKRQPKNLQRSYATFKKEWMAKHDKTRTTEPAFRKA